MPRRRCRFGTGGAQFAHQVASPDRLIRAAEVVDPAQHGAELRSHRLLGYGGNGSRTPGCSLQPGGDQVWPAPPGLKQRAMRNVVWGGNAGAVEHARVQRALDQEALAAVEALGKNFTTQAPTRNVGNVPP